MSESRTPGRPDRETPHRARARRGPPCARLALAGCAGILLAAGPARPDDTDLFRTNVPPNVLLVVDNSKSMTNGVWHPDYGKQEADGTLWKDQTDCTYFRDAFTAAGNTSSNPTFQIYPGGRAVNLKDPTGFVVRTRGATGDTSHASFAWEPPVLDQTGAQRWNDADADEIQDAGEWLAYYKTCNPADNSAAGANRYARCTALADADNDGVGGVSVRDASGNVIIHAATGRPYVYLYEAGNIGGTAVKVRTFITPDDVARATGINPDLTFQSLSICGHSANGYSLPEGEPDKTTPNGQSMQIEGRYLDFLFSSPYGDTAREAVFAPSVGNDGIRSKSSCISLDPGEPSSYETYRRTRLAALRLTLQTVTCELKEKVRFGLMQFRYSGITGDDNGGYVKLPVKSLKDANGDPTVYTLDGISDTHENHMKRVITGVGPDAQTPLNEALFQGYTFFMSRDPSELPPGRDAAGNPVTGVSFPVYEYNMDAHNSDPDDGGDLNLPGGEYVGTAVTTTRPTSGAPASLNADGVDVNGDGGLVTFPALNSSAAPDPIDCGGGVPCGCQKSFMLVVTDGFSSGDLFDDQDTRVNASFGDPTDFPTFNPVETGTDRGFSDFRTLIGDHYRNADGSADETEEPAGSSGTNYMDDIAYFMSRWDFRPDLDGDQTLDTYTVGYSVDNVGVSNAELAAQRGNGLYFESHDADELSSAIIAALSDIIEKSQSFTSATVPASRTTDGNNFYSSFFLPKEDSPFWDGHLKNFEFTGSGDILTSSGTCAVGTDSAAVPPCDTSGPLRTSAEAFWDASEEVPAPAARRLYVGKGGTAFGAQPDAWSLADVDEYDLLLPYWVVDPRVPAMLLSAPYVMTDPSDAAEQADVTEKIVSNLAGCEYGTLLGSDCVARTNEDGTPSLLGDIFHSNPIVVGSPNAPLNDSSYQAFALAYRQRDRVIYAGSNDGFLHGFLAGEFQTTEPDGITPLIPPRHDRGTGEELMAFMPSWVRQRVFQLPGSQAVGAVRSFATVDGSPVVGDAWLYREVQGDGSLGDVLDPPVSSAKQEEQWRTVLVGGLRSGGIGYYALDVTDPDASDYPGYLWEFPCEDCTNALNPNTLADEAAYLGQSWSDPVIARVRVAVEGDATPGGHDRWVAIFGAGYHQYGDPNHTGYWEFGVDPLPSQDVLNNDLAATQGRAIYMVDLTTGQVLAKKRFLPVVSVGDNVHDSRLQYAFASSPAVFDLDFDGYADVVYIGDLGGNLWKWVITEVGDDPIHNSSADRDPGQPDWPFKLFFQADHSSSPSAPSYGTTHFQSFFFPPTGSLRQGKLALAIGAGERAAPEAGVLDGDDSNNNHFYVLRDFDPLERTSTPLDTLTESSTGIFDNADIDSGSYSCVQIGAGKGYFLTARDTEKFITHSAIFLGDVLTGSFVPAPAGSDPCSDTGSSFLYRFSLECGEPAYPSNPGTDNDKRRKAIGGGIPTRPRVSVGGLNQGGASTGCDNKVVVITSDGAIDNDCPGPLPSSGINVRSWRER